MCSGWKEVVLWHTEMFRRQNFGSKAHFHYYTELNGRRDDDGL
jgi:hypothetical protein